MIFAAVAAFALACGRSAPTVTTDSGLPDAPSGISEISPAEAQSQVSRAYSQFVDVRTPEEYAAGHAERAINIPLSDLPGNLDRLERNEPVYLICQSGRRSADAAKILNDAGFSNVFNIAGGMNAWESGGLPMVTGTPDVSRSRLDERTESALKAALADERLARATYTAVLSKFPGARPFVNIVDAEERHESELLPLFEKYGVNVPNNESDPAAINVPDSVDQACQEGVAGEKRNIEMYDGFLQFVKEPDIRSTFERLQAASRDNHLPAFTRCGGGSATRGRGPGRPQ